MSASIVTAVVTAAAETEAHSDPAIPPWAMGLLAFFLLMALLIGLVVFGGGREHS